MIEKIYLDNNATTKCDEEVFNARLPFLTDNYGIPVVSNFTFYVKCSIITI